jgi:hypothetical protein
MLVSHSNLSGRVLRALGRANVLDGSDRSPQVGIGSGEADGLTAVGKVAIFSVPVYADSQGKWWRLRTERCSTRG